MFYERNWSKMYITFNKEVVWLIRDGPRDRRPRFKSQFTNPHDAREIHMMSPSVSFLFKWNKNQNNSYFIQLL